MHSPPADSCPHRSAPPTPDGPDYAEVEPRERRNLFLLAVHQIVLRVGWIFKTESVIIPFFVDQVAGARWKDILRGCLPVLNRLGQGVPPLFSANYLRTLRRKKRALAALAALMSVPFLALSVTWFGAGARQPTWMPALFLALYFVFFVLYGLYLVTFGTVQGKLIPPTRRGYLILASTFWGAVPATLVALLLMPYWLEPPSPSWGHVFMFVAVCFLGSGLIALLLSEPDGAPAPRRVKQAGTLAETVRVLREDANLRRLTLVAVLVGTGLIILPHYQALPRTELELSGSQLSGSQLMLWVITQNVAVAATSLFVGPLADRRGYRLTLRLLIFASAIAPAFAISLFWLLGDAGANLFWLVYVALGVMPLIPRALLNYALEVCEPAAHARYQAVVSLGLASPFLLSPGVGWLVYSVGFDWVFLSTVVIVLLGGFLTFHLDEPRHRIRDAEAEAAGVGAPE